MKTLNLIYPEQSDIRFEAMTFPDGQPHIRIDMDSVAGTDRDLPVHIITRLNTPDDLLRVLFLKNALDYLEFTRVELFISFLMAARMDRVMQEGEPFSLKVVASVLNQAAFRKVIIFDPHSEVVTALIDRSYVLSNRVLVRSGLNDYFQRNGNSDFCLVSPDAGALKKIYKIARALGVERVIECTKERDVKTGELLRFATTANDLSGLTCFVIDDICDGGGTFRGAARLLREKGAEKVVLIVSHGIFSRGITIEGVDAIYTTDSYRFVPDVHCYPVSGLLKEAIPGPVY